MASSARGRLPRHPRPLRPAPAHALRQSLQLQRLRPGRCRARLRRRRPGYPRALGLRWRWDALRPRESRRLRYRPVGRRAALGRRRRGHVGWLLRGLYAARRRGAPPAGTQGHRAHRHLLRSLHRALSRRRLGARRRRQLGAHVAGAARHPARARSRPPRCVDRRPHHRRRRDDQRRDLSPPAAGNDAPHRSRRPRSLPGRHAGLHRRPRHAAVAGAAGAPRRSRRPGAPHRRLVRHLRVRHPPGLRGPGERGSRLP